MESDSRLLELNDRYGNLTYLDRLKMLFGEFEPEEILVTTSFGSTSIALIHMISKVAPRHPVHLINTGYLFKETIQYRDQLINEFDLNVVDVQPRERSHEFTSNHKVWEGNPDFCCFINKVEPLNALKKGKKVWVSGLLGFQNENRAGKRIFEESQGLLKFHPIIDMSQEDLNHINDGMKLQ